MTFDYVYFWKATPMRPLDRKGHRCRLLVIGTAMNSVLIEFEDGLKVVTSRNAIRKVEEVKNEKTKQGIQTGFPF